MISISLSDPIESGYHGGMKVLLASPRGFCAGVNMAIESLDLALASLKPPIYVYHEIVHNKYVVEQFRGRGVTFVDDLVDVPVGATLLFSAHGVSPEIRRVARERRLRAIDATCPLVTKVHLEAIKYAKSGYTILLIGHEGHDEVIGTLGECPRRSSSSRRRRTWRRCKSPMSRRWPTSRKRPSAWMMPTGSSTG